MSLIEIGIEYIKNVDLDQLTINQAGLNGLGSFDGSYDSSNNDFKENEIEFSNIDSFGLNNSELDFERKINQIKKKEHTRNKVKIIEKYKRNGIIDENIDIYTLYNYYTN